MATPKLNFDDHKGFQRDVLGATAGGCLGALAFWLLGVNSPWLGAQPYLGTVMTWVATGVGLGVSRGRPLSIFFGGAAGLVGALVSLLVPAEAGLLGGLLLGGALGLPLARLDEPQRRWSAVLGAAALGMVAVLLTGSPAGRLPLSGLPEWAAAALGGASFAFLVAWGSIVGHLRLQPSEAAAAAPQALPADVPEALRTFAEQAEATGRRIQAVLAQHTGDPALLQRVRLAGDRLTAQVSDQIRRWHGVEREIDPGGAERLARRTEELQQRIEQTEDASARAGFEAARDALVAQLRLHKRLSVGRERLVARLHQNVATLEKLHLTLVDLKSADAQRFSLEVHPVLDEVAELSQEADIMAEVGDALAALSRPGAGEPRRSEPAERSGASSAVAEGPAADGPDAEPAPEASPDAEPIAQTAGDVVAQAPDAAATPAPGEAVEEAQEEVVEEAQEEVLHA